jgi:hypothetical protein
MGLFEDIDAARMLLDLPERFGRSPLWGSEQKTK